MPADKRIDYIELPGANLSAMKTFYSDAFGWGFEDFGATYAGFQNAGLDGGIQGNTDEATSAPLIIVYAASLEESLAEVEAAGGEVTVPIFSFPGGRRFHFRDPAGNELAVWSDH